MDRIKMRTNLLKILGGAGLVLSVAVSANAASQVLVTIANLPVSSDDLDAAMASSPFATQMASMDEDDQAGLRGDMLRRLVAARLLLLEAKRLGLDKTKDYRQDMESFRLGLLYRFYMDKLRERIGVPADTLAAMKQQYKGDAEGLAAAKSAYVSDQYQTLKLATLQNLLHQDDTKLYEERIKTGIKPDVVLMKG